jgi:hypothetical protein
MNDVYQAVMWETARVGGLLAYVLAAASVCLGLLLSLKVRSPQWPRFVTDGLHRHVTIVGLVFTAVHTLAVWLDPFTAFAPSEVFVPFASHYRPLWIGMGTVAAYLMVAVYLSEKIRPHIGYGWWRRFHYVSFAIFVLGTLTASAREATRRRGGRSRSTRRASDRSWCCSPGACRWHWRPRTARPASACSARRHLPSPPGRSSCRCSPAGM